MIIHEDAPSTLHRFFTWASPQAVILLTLNMKLCLVTVGATASFEKLIQQVLSREFLATISKYNYTHLLVQYGKDGQPIFDDFLAKNPEGCEALHGIGIGGFDFKPSMTASVMMAMKNPAKDQEQGMMISHAGEISYQLHATVAVHRCLHDLN